MKDILTVTELTGAIKGLLESGFDTIWVTGEISNLRRPASGHVYFTLKDESSQIRVVAFRSAAGRIGFDLEDGMKIVLGPFKWPSNSSRNVWEKRVCLTLLIKRASHFCRRKSG